MTSQLKLMKSTTDNNGGMLKIEDDYLSDFQKIANRNINNLLTTNEDLLVFPQSLNKYGDEIGKQSIFTLQESQLTTGNIMGFIGVNNSELTIKSRFAQDDNDYFLHYMLQKVFAINLFDLKHSTNYESVFDFLLYIFPYYLKKALRQGLFKAYQKFAHNDANVRGAIDVSRHIKQNVPFVGKVAYRTREYSYDNRITQLVRHTIEYIHKHPIGQGVLSNDSETQNYVRQIRQATPSYHRRQLASVIHANTKPLVHPYFSDYTALQKICLQILRHENLKYGKEPDKIYGLLFDGAWLWEEYLNTILQKIGFRHPQNNRRIDPIYLFQNSKSYKRYPDFLKDNFVLDAKYKRFYDIKNETHKKINRDDMHQIISYMYVEKAEKGGFIFPKESEQTDSEIAGELRGYGGEVWLYGLYIPKNAKNYRDFYKKIQKNEELALLML